jgi:hypothetical protein
MADADRFPQLTITFTDGTVQTFNLNEPPPTENTPIISSRLKHIIESNCLMLEVDNRLLLFPMQNIRCIEINPSLAKLPDTVIRHLSEVV